MEGMIFFENKGIIVVDDENQKLKGKITESFKEQFYSSSPKAKRKLVKILIELSSADEEADKIIEDYYAFKTVEEKIAFLKGMFNIETVGHNSKDLPTYYAMLRTIRTVGEC